MKNMIIRALRTFFQAALGYVAGNLVAAIAAAGGLTKDVIIGVVTPAVALGLAALMNLPSPAPDVEVAYGEREAARGETPQKVVGDIDELPAAGQTEPAFEYDEAIHGECDTDNDEEDGGDE